MSIFPTLNTDRLVLEPITEAHAALVLEMIADERLYRYEPHWLPRSLDELRERFAQYSKGLSRSGQPQLNWAVRRREDQVYVGHVQATFFDLEPLIGYMTFVPFWKLGYAREATAAMLDCLKVHYRVRAAVASVDVENAASVALLEVLEFERVGSAPSQYLDGHIEYRYHRVL